eukprot:Anaeramoba_ignava/c15236_g1_i1.p1 GENE.c15236_g1_i1~~c15236_g1_i1.p1  ORF type:complete len:185 (-),score=-6.53 c15236_g1_i1:265-819(-)
MKKKVGIIILLAITITTITAKSCGLQKDCNNKDKPICYNGECVECTKTEHCKHDKYCDTGEHQCRRYDSDNKWGKFCNSENCYESGIVCGVCSTDREWTGACISNKCEQCRVSSQDGIVAQHPDAICAPISTSGDQGLATSYQSDLLNVPLSLKQSSLSIAFLVIGFVLLTFSLLHCFSLCKNF